VVTGDSLADQMGVVRGSYDAVPLPPASVVQVRSSCSVLDG
jgi:hypothetical protein